MDQCVICQKAKDSKGSDKLTSTTEGRQVIIKSSEKLQDGLFERIGIQNGDNIKYHVKTCYATYKRKGERHTDSIKRKPADSDNSPLTPRTKRCKPVISLEPKDKPCVICNHVKCQGDSKRFRIETVDVADHLLKAANFNKDEVEPMTI